MTINRFVQVLFAVLLVIATTTALLIVFAANNRRTLVQIQQKRFEAYQLAAELRQSSDDLTRFVRTYVTTGDPKYEQYYRDVLAIRSGEKPRPEHYERIYWDFFIDQGHAPRPAIEAMPLLRLVETIGATDQELAKLREALNSSNELVNIEETAMHAMKGQYRDETGAFTKTGPPDQALAIRLVHDDAYHHAKARIMEPIDQFEAAAKERADAEMDKFNRDTAALFRIFNPLLALFFGVVVISYPLFRRRVLLPIFALQQQTHMVAADLDRFTSVATQIANGNLDQSFTVSTPPMRATRSDEIGELSRLHDSMIGQLEVTSSAIASITAELSGAKEHLEEIFNTTPIAVVVAADGITRYANPRFREWFGIHVGESVLAVYDDIADRQRIMDRLGEQGVVRDQLLKMRSTSGEVLDALCTFYSIQFDGKPAILSWLVDITQLKQVEKALEEAKLVAEAATRAKSSFLATMSHEIRTPMNGVMAMAEMLDQTELSADQRSMSSVIRASAESLMTILNDILDFSKIEAGKFEMEAIPFDLGETIEEAAELVATRADEKGIELAVEIDPALPSRIIGDPTRVRQVVLNFLSNAIKFTESGSVRLRVGMIGGDMREGEFLIEVIDTGIGMTEAQSSKLFQAFAQADSSTSRRFGGTGLGLSISQRLAEMMGGAVGVKSSPGNGSTFWFKLTTTISNPDPAHPIADISDARILALGFSPRGRSALETILTAARITDVIWERDPLSTEHDMDRMGPNSIPIVFLAGGTTNAIRTSKQITQDRGNARAILAAPRALASTLTAAPDAGAFDTLTMPLRRRRIWLSIAAALGRASLTDAVRTTNSASEHFYPPSEDQARAHAAIVLVAEDNPTNQQVIKRVLDRAGFVSLFAENGSIALELLNQDPGIGLLLTDYHMPIMDGLELTSAIRSQEAMENRCRLPIVMLTADALPETERAMVEAGCDGYLTKPMRYVDIRRALEKWLPAGALLRGSRPSGDAPRPVADVATSTIDLTVLTDLIGQVDRSQIAETLTQFWEAVQSAADDIEANAAAMEAPQLRELAHSLKGAVSAIGGKAAAAELLALEMAAKDQAWERIAPLLPRIRSAFSDLHVFIEDYRAQSS